MKLLIITSLKEFKKDVSNMLEKAQIPIFSFSDIIGVKASYIPELSDDWFTSDNDREFRSVFFFSFTDNEKAENVLKQITVFNTLDRVEYPVRGFILPVEKAV
jgi:hypothetical protein